MDILYNSVLKNYAERKGQKTLTDLQASRPKDYKHCVKLKCGAAF